MLPVHLLSIQPGETILDLCAAPGSKSKQIVELLGDHPQSLIVANDNDFKRATMLAY